MRAIWVIAVLGLGLTPVIAEAQQFGPASPTPSFAPSFAVGDVNRDGLTDLVTVQGWSLQVHLATTPGRFAAAVAHPLSEEVYGGEGEKVVLADFNRDGHLDVAAVTFQSVVTLAGGPQGFGAPRLAYRYNRGEVKAIQAGDLNGDQKPDLFVAMYGASHTQVMSLVGDGTGGFVPGSVHQGDIGGTLSARCQTVALGDFNGDGKLDAVAGSRNDGGVVVLFGLGDGRLEAPVRFAGADQVVSVATADLDRDGKSELLFGGSGLALWSQDGGVRRLSMDDWVTAVESGDVDRDGNADLVAIGGFGGVYLARGDGRGALSEFGAPAGVHVDNVDAALTDLNQDGYLDLVAAFLGGGMSTSLYQPSSDDRLRTSADALIRIEHGVAGVAQAISAIQLPNLGNLSALDAAVSSRASQASVDVLTAYAANLDAPVSTRASANDLAALHGAIGAAVADAAAQLRDAALRDSIEEALARSERRSTFYLPDAYGGVLERVRQVVVDEIDRHRAAGLGVGRAETLLTKGDQQLQGQHYRLAFDAYAEAYQAMTR